MSLFTNAKRQFNTYITAGTVLNSELSYACPANGTRLLEHLLSHHPEYAQLDR